MFAMKMFDPRLRTTSLIYKIKPKTQEKKWAKDMKRQFIEKEVQRALKYK